jgi:hypothetical protein
MVVQSINSHDAPPSSLPVQPSILAVLKIVSPLKTSEIELGATLSTRVGEPGSEKFVSDRPSFCTKVSASVPGD